MTEPIRRKKLLYEIILETLGNQTEPVSKEFLIKVARERMREICGWTPSGSWIDRELRRMANKLHKIGAVRKGRRVYYTVKRRNKATAEAGDKG